MCGSVVAELALGAAPAEQNDLRRLVEAVTAQVRPPAFLIRRQPKGLALGAMSDDGDLLGAHETLSLSAARAGRSGARGLREDVVRTIRGDVDSADAVDERAA
jgi:hypothetical protein